jgi:hypothetical protein
MRRTGEPLERKVYPGHTSDYESDAGMIQYHDSHIDESEGYTSLFEQSVSDADAIIECGQGGAAQANAYHGTQIGGIRTPDAGTFKLRGW